MEANLTLTAKELELVRDALDSHVYWQLSEEPYRRDGHVVPPGTEDPQAAADIAGAHALIDRLDGELRALRGSPPTA